MMSTQPITVECLPAFSDNYIWLIRRGRLAAAVDPGDATPVLAALDAEKLTLTTILVTHHHGDHTGGISALRKRYNVPVYGPAGEPIPERTHSLLGGEDITLPQLDCSFQVLAMPGHTRAAVAYYGHGLVFVGDTLFAGGCGRLFEGTATTMYRSLKQLAALPSDTLVYCAHEYTVANLTFAVAVEPDNQDLQRRLVMAQRLRAADKPTIPATISEELATNPFLRSNEAAVRQAAERHSGRTQSDPCGVFATIREWKDRFTA